MQEWRTISTTCVGSWLGSPSSCLNRRRPWGTLRELGERSNTGRSWRESSTKSAERWNSNAFVLWPRRPESGRSEKRGWFGGSWSSSATLKHRPQEWAVLVVFGRVHERAADHIGYPGSERFVLVNSACRRKEVLRSLKHSCPLKGNFLPRPLHLHPRSRPAQPYPLPQ